MTNVQSENIRCRFASFFPSLPRSISLETIAPVRCCMHTVCIWFVQICKYSYGRASVIHKSVNRWVYYVAYVNFHWTNFQYVNVWHHHNMLESSHVSFASPSDWRVTLLQKGWAYVSTEMVKAMSKWCQTSAQVWFLNVFCLLKYSTVTYIQTSIQRNAVTTGHSVFLLSEKYLGRCVSPVTGHHLWRVTSWCLMNACCWGTVGTRRFETSCN